MANRIANLLGNTKTRTLVLLVVGILIFGIVIAVTQSGSKTSHSPQERISKTTEVPTDVKSTPGEQVSRRYRELQEQANIRGAAEAAKAGTTFIPTVTGSATGYDDKEFEKQLSAAYDDLGGKCSKETVEKLRRSGMDTSKVILELKCYGCSAAALTSLFGPQEIAAALLTTGCELETTGCSAEDAKKLQEAGNNPAAIAAVFKKNGCSLAQTAAALKANNVSPADIAAALKATGATAAQIATAMKESGFSNADIATGLKGAGFGIDDITMALKGVGANASEIADALTKAGFSKLDILPALTKAGFSAVDIAKAMSSLDQTPDTSRQAANQRLAAQQESQSLAAYNQQRQTKITELVAAMEAQKSQAMQAWNEIPQQVMVQGEWSQKQPSGANGTTGADGKTVNGKTIDDAANAEIILKAGTILFATLDTAVNSDEKGPITATIVSGELKGSKLMGAMSVQTDSETIALNFSAINMPKEKKSMGISAVAIDPDTARTALASDVDHHYLLRWGSLFASSFVQGYASAVASAGQTQTVSQGAAGTVTTTSSPALSGRQQLFQGIASIGTKWSDVVGKNFDRPITITIDQGTGIGVLLTADLTYGTDPVFYSATPNNPSIASNAQPALPGATTTAAGAGLSTDQTAALINSLVKQQNSPGESK